MSIASSLASILGSKKEPVQAGLAYYDANNGEEIRETLQAFQYYPEKISDTKGVEYSQKSIPGGSHPIYTFISGGERVISFEAIFINDTGDGDEILFQQWSLPSVSKRDETDIPAALAWLRAAMYPTYDKGVAKAPPLVILYLPQSKIMSALPKTNQSIGLTSLTRTTVNSLVGILTRADISYEAFHRSGKPRIAVVSIEIKEVVQNKKNWQFQDGNEISTRGSYTSNPFIRSDRI